MDLPTQRPAFDPVAVTGLEVANDAGAVNLKLTSPGDPGDNTVIRASKPQNSGVRRTPQMQVLGKCDITALYTAKFGTPPVSQRIFVSAGLTQDGWLGPVLPFTALVPAAA